jgi:MFS family permease
LLRNRNFMFLWFVSVAIVLAIELFSVTIMVTIFEQTDSTLQAAGTMVARTLPAFLLGPVAGVLVDRFPRKYVIISMDLIRVILVGITIFLLQAGDDVPVMGFYLILVGISAAGVFHRPARMSLIPSVVDHSQLVSANSFILVSSQIVLALSYTIGSWLILAVPMIQIAMGIITLFFLAIIVASLINVPKQEKAKNSDEKESFRKTLIEGWQYLRRHPIARPLTVMETIEHLPHGIWTGAVMLTFTIQAFGADVTEWGYQVTGYFVGMIVGSLIAMAMERWLKLYPGRIIVATACVAGFLTLSFALSPTVEIAVIVAFFFGPPFAIRDVAQDSLLQGTVEQGQLGRVYATREMLRSVVFMFAGVFFAWLAAYVPIRLIYVIGGSIYILTGIYALSNKALRQSKMTLDEATA